MNHTNYIWEIQKVDDSLIELLKQQLKISVPLAKVLGLRGIKDFESASAYFRPKWESFHDGFKMKDMKVSVERVNKAISKEQNILIYGDYDVDGTCSVAIMKIFLKSIGGNIYSYQPDREIEGYGISLKSVEWMVANKIDIIIALDCGIKDFKSAKAIKDAKMDLIICDHHKPSEKLPECFSILNPKQNGCNYPFKDLCGCGIGFKLIQCYAKNYKVEIDYSPIIQLTAIATTADVVPLKDENRLITYFGLKAINKNPIPALKKIFELSLLKGEISSSDLVFKIAPRINAAGRLSSAEKATNFLISDEKECGLLSSEIEQMNDKRKEIDQQVTEEALLQLKNQPINRATNLVYSPNWHKGVVGIVASRIIEKYYKPTIVLTGSEEILTGSVRSVKGFDVYKVLVKFKNYFTKFGGHNFAAGLSLKKENLNLFFRAFEDEVKSTIKQELKCPKFKIDSHLKLNSLIFDSKKQDFSKTYRIIKQMEPFGLSNPKPIFLFKNLILNRPPRIVGKKHLKLNFTDDEKKIVIDGIWFNSSSFSTQIKGAKYIDVVASLTENFFLGQLSLQLMVNDVKIVK
tara:strand:+ start:13927 stop:15651 length:1725 start_codon:yes stop_codon:yes gene_type:complete